MSSIHFKIRHGGSETEPFYGQHTSITEQNRSEKLGPFQVLRRPYTV